MFLEPNFWEILTNSCYTSGDPVCLSVSPLLGLHTEISLSLSDGMGMDRGGASTDIGEGF